MNVNKIAAFDLGTNSFICLIASLGSDGNIIVHEELIEQVRLGKGLSEDGFINDEALKRADSCLQKFREACLKHGVFKIRALATSAARDAKNGDELFKMAAKYQFSLDIISGQQEARYCGSGSLVNLGISNSPILIIDIGGGSTEFIFIKDDQIIELKSFNIGAVKLTERFLKNQPANSKDLESFSSYLDTELKVYLSKYLNLPSLNVVGIAGTPTSLVAAKIGKFEEEKIHGSHLSLLEIEKWIHDFKSCSVEEIRTRYNFGQRSDIILAGTIILHKALMLLGANKIIVSTKGVRYGLALEMLNEK